MNRARGSINGQKMKKCEKSAKCERRSLYWALHKSLWLTFRKNVEIVNANISTENDRHSPYVSQAYSTSLNPIVAVTVGLVQSLRRLLATIGLRKKSVTKPADVQTLTAVACKII